MSTRVVYFGPGILHWECLCSYHIEPNPEAQCFTRSIDYSGKDLDTRRRLKLAVKTLQQQKLPSQNK